MATARVLLLRHGQSTWNAEGRWQGWADPPLTPLGEEQARDALAHLRDAGITAVVTSDLQRARRTGEIIAEGLGLGAAAVEVEADLREHSVGEFQGNTVEENKRRFPDAWDGDRVVAIPGGEPKAEVIARVVPALLRIAHRHPDDVVLVVSHAGVVRILEEHLGVTRDFRLANLGGRWFDVCEGGRITSGEAVTPIEPSHITRPAEE